MGTWQCCHKSSKAEGDGLVCVKKWTSFLVVLYTNMQTTCNKSIQSNVGHSSQEWTATKRNLHFSGQLEYQNHLTQWEHIWLISQPASLISQKTCVRLNPTSLCPKHNEERRKTICYTWLHCKSPLDLLSWILLTPHRAPGCGSDTHRVW